MRKGFTKAEKEIFETKLGEIDSAIDSLIEFIREKHERADEWMSERSEAWFESESCEIFEEWHNDLDFKIDELENFKSELDLDTFEEILL